MRRDCATSNTKLTIYSAWMCFQDLCDNSSPLTARAYTADVKTFARSCHLAPEEALYQLLREGPEAARVRVTEWSRRMIRSHAGATVSRRISALKSFVSHAGEMRLVDWKLNVVSTHRQKSGLSAETLKATAERDMSGLDRENFEKVLAVLETAAATPQCLGKPEEERIAAIRDIAIIALLENPALRRSEVCSLNIRDVDLGDEPAVTFIGKGRREPATLPLSGRVARYIERWRSLRRGDADEPLFTRFRRPQFGATAGTLVMTKERISGSGVYALCLARGVKALGQGRSRGGGAKKEKQQRLRMNPHSLRHTGVSKLAELHAKGVLTLKEAMAVSRHKKTETFLRYVDETSKAKRTAVNAMDAM